MPYALGPFKPDTRQINISLDTPLKRLYTYNNVYKEVYDANKYRFR